MVMATRETTVIDVRVSTRETLRGLKVYRRETYDEVILRAVAALTREQEAAGGGRAEGET